MLIGPGGGGKWGRQECACLVQLSTLVLVLCASGRPTQFLCEPCRFPSANWHPSFDYPRTVFTGTTRDQRLRAQIADGFIHFRLQSSPDILQNVLTRIVVHFNR